MNFSESFTDGMSKTAGTVVALVVIFVVAPCMVCGGMATCGKVLEGQDTQSSYEFEE